MPSTGAAISICPCLCMLSRQSNTGFASSLLFGNGSLQGLICRRRFSRGSRRNLRIDFRQVCVEWGRCVRGRRSQIATLVHAFDAPDVTMAYSDMHIFDGQGKLVAEMLAATREMARPRMAR